MKTFKIFFEVVVVLIWCILVICNSLSSLIIGEDYSPSNDSILTFITFGFLTTQIWIKWEIQRLKEEQ